MCRLYGLNGAVDTHYFGRVTVKAREFHADGEVVNLYQGGVVANIETFHDNITKGDFNNPSVPAAVRSNLTTILGRTAAYKNSMVSWDEMIKANEKPEADLKGLRA